MKKFLVAALRCDNNNRNYTLTFSCAFSFQSGLKKSSVSDTDRKMKMSEDSTTCGNYQSPPHVSQLLSLLKYGRGF